MIEGADEINVILHDDTRLKAEVLGRDSKTDVAVLKIKTDKKLVPASWGDSDKARVGDWVLAIGNPFGLGGSVSAGILSARQRDIHSGPYDDYLQTDAAINRGNSGGPMFNVQGEVIGINTAIYSPSGGSIGIGFAIPSNIAREIATELISDPEHVVHRGWLGVRIQAVTDEVAETLGLDKPRGALVASVNENGPAQSGGIQPGDVILSFDGKPVNDVRHLPRVVAATKVGKTVPVTVWRKRQQETVQVAVGRLDETEEAAAWRRAERQAVEIGKSDRDGARSDLVEHHRGAEGQVFAEGRQGRRRARRRQRQPGGQEGARTRRRDPGGLATGDQERGPDRREDRRSQTGRPQLDPDAGRSPGRAALFRAAPRPGLTRGRCGSAEAGMTHQPGAISASR